MAASKKAVQRYKQKAYDQIQLRVKKGERALISKYAEEHGLSVNAFISGLIYREMGDYIPAAVKEQGSEAEKD
jgi:uncharacterized protein (DUF1778 family)